MCNEREKNCQKKKKKLRELETCLDKQQHSDISVAGHTLTVEPLISGEEKGREREKRKKKVKRKNAAEGTSESIQTQSLSSSDSALPRIHSR